MTAAESQPIIRARGLRMAFAGVEVLRGVDLELRPGEVHALVGENGAGKSTLAKIIAGVHRPVGGTLELESKPIELGGPRHALELGLALIHQEPLTFPDLTVAENIFVGHQPLGAARKVDWRQMTARAEELLHSIGANFSPKALAGGLSVADQQMIELACALSHDVKVLLMDETTAALTPKEVNELFAVVRRLRDQGSAVVLVSHRLDEVFEIADRITVLRDGEKVGEKRTAETTIPEIIQMMVGREMTLTGRLTGSADTPVGAVLESPLLRIRGLSGGSRFRDVSFEVRTGEIVALAGLVGAGRTEVCETIFGVRSATAGTAEIGIPDQDSFAGEGGGRPKVSASREIRNPRDAIALGVAMVPEDRQHDGLLLPLPISLNASLANLKRLSSRGWLNEKREQETTKDFLTQLHTAYRSVGQPVRELSGGNQQKVVLAKWLMTKPRLLILDEPTRGVDVGAKAEVHRLMRELADQGLAILMVSSDLPEVLGMGDRILVMREGHLVAEFSGPDADAEQVMLAATGQVAGAA